MQGWREYVLAIALGAIAGLIVWAVMALAI